MTCNALPDFDGYGHFRRWKSASRQPVNIPRKSQIHLYAGERNHSTDSYLKVCGSGMVYNADSRSAAKTAKPARRMYLHSPECSDF